MNDLPQVAVDAHAPIRTTRRAWNGTRATRSRTASIRCRVTGRRCFGRLERFQNANGRMMQPEVESMECHRDGTPTPSQPPSCRPLLDRCIGLTQDSFQEILATSGASHADDYWPHIRLGHELERQEGAALPFCHNHFRYHRNPLAIAGNAESVTIAEFLSLDDSRPKLGEQRCLTLA
jgi:hypothetical protein